MWLLQGFQMCGGTRCRWTVSGHSAGAGTAACLWPHAAPALVGLHGGSGGLLAVSTVGGLGTQEGAPSYTLLGHHSITVLHGFPGCSAPATVCRGQPLVTGQLGLAVATSPDVDSASTPAPTRSACPPAASPALPGVAPHNCPGGHGTAQATLTWHPNRAPRAVSTAAQGWLPPCL